MKHVLDVLRDAPPVVGMLSGEGLRIPTGVRITLPTRQVADYRTAKSLFERDVIERALVQACPDVVSTVGEEQVFAAAAGFGVDATRFERYADRRWGPGWMRSANGRHQVLDEIERYRNDPEGFADKIDVHLNLPGKPA